jgi:hypothetical protein
MKCSSIITSLLFLSVLAACHNLNTSPEVKRIDSLKYVLFKVNSELAEVDSQKVSKILIDYQNNTGQLERYFDGNDQNKVWDYLTQFAEINEMLSDFMNKRGNFIKQVHTSTVQLENLRSDFINRTISKEQFNVFFQQESDFIKNLNKNVKISVNNSLAGINQYDTLNPKILIIIEKLKKRKPNTTKNK